MWVTKSDIIARVRLLLDEIGTNDGDFEDGKDEQELDTLIEGFALEALRFVNLNAPHELLEADARKSAAGATPNVYQELPGLLPGTVIGVFYEIEKFLRLVCVRCMGWNKPVYDAVMENSPAWDMLLNKYLTGTVEDPKVSVGKAQYGISMDNYGNAEIRLYCLPKPAAEGGMRVAEVYYMEQPEWREKDPGEGNEDAPIEYEVHLSFLLQDAFFYYLTYLALNALGDNRSQTALQQALPLMGLSTQASTGNGE